VVEKKREEETAPQRTNESLVVELNKKKTRLRYRDCREEQRGKQGVPYMGYKLN
jgi:hypothetical protein